jgi:hypothetical protein
VIGYCLLDRLAENDDLPQVIRIGLTIQTMFRLY